MTTGIPDRHHTFILDKAGSLLRLSERLTFYFWIAKAFGAPENDTRLTGERRSELTWWAVEFYVLSWTVVAGLAYCAVSGAPSCSILCLITMLFAAVRIFEIMRFQFELVLAPPAKSALRAYRRSIILLLLNYTEIVLWFSAIYTIFCEWKYFVIELDPPMLVILRESIGLMVANSSGGFAKPSGYAVWTVLILHCAVGLFMTTVIAARVISLLPRLISLDKDEGGGPSQG